MSRTIRDIYNNQDIRVSLLPAVRNADANGTWVDLRDFDGNLISVSVGAGGIVFDGTNRIEFLVQESDDASTPNSVANEDLLGFSNEGAATGTIAVVNAPGDASQVYAAQYRGNKRYIRIVADFFGTHATGTPVASNVHRGYAHLRPVR